jgi:lipopolysaccharide export LptBFGC system permease protein LptF
VSFSFAAVALAVLAVPLGIRPLRAGRSWGALVAVGLMGLYWVIFSLGELAAERGIGPAWLGVWIANACAVGTGLLLIRRSSRADS